MKKILRLVRNSVAYAGLFVGVYCGVFFILLFVVGVVPFVLTVHFQNLEKEKYISVFTDEVREETGVDFRVKYSGFKGIHSYVLYMSAGTVGNDVYFGNVCEVLSGIYEKVLARGDDMLLRTGYGIRTDTGNRIDFRCDFGGEKYLETDMFCDYSAFKALEPYGFQLIIDTTDFKEEQLDRISNSGDFEEIRPKEQ